jgi:2-methylcitrate dehydratase PrpD
VFGDAARYTKAGAAFLNGAHSLDFADTDAAGSLHPGAPVIPTAFAAGEMAGASGAGVLAGIIAGYEITCHVDLTLPADVLRLQHRRVSTEPACGRLCHVDDLALLTAGLIGAIAVRRRAQSGVAQLAATPGD